MTGADLRLRLGSNQQRPMAWALYHVELLTIDFLASPSTAAHRPAHSPQADNTSPKR